MKIIFREPKLPIIASERLILRDIQLDDISPEYIAWLNNPDINKYLEIRFSEQTEETVKKFIESNLDDTVSRKHFGVYDNDGKRLVGNVSAHLDLNHKSAHISYIIGHQDAMGKGYATEAVHAVVYFLFNYCDVEEIAAGFYGAHKESGKVLEKNGFTVQACLKKRLIGPDGNRVDLMIAGILPEQFKPDTMRLGQLPPEEEKFGC